MTRYENKGKKVAAALTRSRELLRLSHLYDRWSDATVAYTAIRMSVTDAASAAGSLLMDLRVDGASKFSVRKTGSVTLAAVKAVEFSSGYTQFDLRGSGGTVVLDMDPDGDVGSATNFSLEYQGGSIFAVSSGGVVTLGGVGTPTARSGSGTPESVVTAVRGSTFMRTDGGAGTSFYVKESGTGNTGWVAK